MTLPARAVVSTPPPVILSPSTGSRTSSAKNLGMAQPGCPSLSGRSAAGVGGGGGGGVLTILPVSTPSFLGPLALLLHLIEREDLDITAVSLVQVTDQYLALLRSADQIDLRALADFVAAGAKLLLLKSRALLPRTPEEVEADELEAEEIAQDLTAQLEEDRGFKSAASYLRELEDATHRSFARVAPPPAGWRPSGLERVTLKKLLKALAQALERLPAE